MSQTQTQKHAWLDRVLEDHIDLKESLAELRGFLSSPRPEVGMQGFHTWAAACAIRLVELHDKLFRHFRFEEQDGMLRDLARLHPRSLSKVESIERDHPQILESMRSIVADVLQFSEGKPPEDSRIRQRIRAVLDHLASHEEAEMDLIQRVMYRDTGAQD